MSKKSKLALEDIVIRHYLPSDVHEVRRCIKQSFQELMDEIPCEKVREGIQGHLDSLFQTELASEASLAAKYQSQDAADTNGESFLVSAFRKNEPNKLVGVVGGIQHGPFELELVRLFVAPEYRGIGLGRALTQRVISFAESHGYERVILTCGSTSGQALYTRCGFKKAGEYLFWKNVKNSRKVEKVAVVGGVHGNELIGIQLVSEVWKRDPNHVDLAQDSLKVQLYIANEDAAYKCTRFVDRDLNRCFELDELQNPRPSEADKRETKRAQWLNSQLGPKCDILGSIARWKRENPNCIDYMLDLHSTVCNMGICLITLASDALTIQLAYHLKQHFEKLKFPVPFYLMVDSECKRTVNNNIDSVTPSGLCFEVGPLAHGTLNNPALFEGTRICVRESLRFIDEFNKRDLENIQEREPATITGYSLWKPLYFPKQKGSYSINAMLHPNIIGKDFQQVVKGDPIFIDLDTGKVVMEYEEDEPAYPCFIGEAAYFTSGIALWLCRKQEYPLYG